MPTYRFRTKNLQLSCLLSYPLRYDLIEINNMQMQFNLHVVTYYKKDESRGWENP